MSAIRSRNNNKQMYEQQSDDYSSQSDSDNEVIELTERDKKKSAKPQSTMKEIGKAVKQKMIEGEEYKKEIVKKPVSEAKLKSIQKAQAVRQENLRLKREQDNENKKLIEKTYRKEVEIGLTKTMLPRYEKKIKKELLEKLKKKKLEQLKKQYNYKSDDSSDDDSDISSEEEVKPKKFPSKSKHKQSKQLPPPTPQAPKQLGILDRYKQYGF